MKKTLKSMLAFAVVALCSTSAWAQALEGTTHYVGSGLQYKITSVNPTAATNKYTVSVSQSDYTNKGAAALVIPETITLSLKGTDHNGAAFDNTVEFVVTAIEDNAFKNTAGTTLKITSVTIPNNVTSIGANAFDGCSNLATITLGTGVKEIGAAAFKGTSIATLDLSSTKVQVVNNLFGTEENKALLSKNYVVATNKPSDGSVPAAAAASVKNDKLETVKFPVTLNEIVAGAFVNCTELANVDFPTSVKRTAPDHALVIGDYAFYGAKIEKLDLSKTDLEVLNPLFHYYNTDLQTVVLPATLTTMKAYALADQIQLSTLTLSTVVSTSKVETANKRYAKGEFVELNNLATIEKYALSNTILTTVDFSNCYKLNFTAATPIFVNPKAKTNSNLATVKLPIYTEYKVNGAGALQKYQPIQTLGITFANCTALTSVEDLENTCADAVVEYAFANDEVLPALSFPGTVTSITGRPFAGCAALATLTIDGTGFTAATDLIGDGFNLFAAIDQAGANLAWPDALVGFNAPEAVGATDALVNLTITKNFGGRIFAGAFFAIDSQIENVTISTGNDGATPVPNKYGITATGVIDAGAIKLNPEPADGKNNVTIGVLAAGIAATAGASAIEGPTATATTVLTFDDISGDCSLADAAFVSGNIEKVTVGAISGATEVILFGKAAAIDFAGNITANVTNIAAYVNNALTSLKFDNASGVGYQITAGSIKAATFDEAQAPSLKTVYWHPADGDAVAAFDKQAFGTATKGALATVTLYTSEKVALTVYGDGTTFDEVTKLHNIKVDFTTVIVQQKALIDVFNEAGASYFWGKYRNTASNVYINQRQMYDATGNYTEDEEEMATEAKVVVYSAYIDENIIYLDPLRKKDGKYVVAAGQPVIIRSNVGAQTKGVLGKQVTAVECTLDPTMRYDGTAAIINDLEVNDLTYSSDDVSTMYAAGKVIYFMANPVSNKGLSFKYVKKTGYLPAGELYLVKEYGSEGEIPAEAPIRVVILDDEGFEDATFINGVEVKANAEKAVNGKIYNMQGIEVNSSYKGFVIKNGKKIYQK